LVLIIANHGINAYELHLSPAMPAHAFRWPLLKLGGL